MDVNTHDVHVSINNEGAKEDSDNNASCTTVINNYNYNNVFNVFNGASDMKSFGIAEFIFHCLPEFYLQGVATRLKQMMKMRSRPTR